MSSRAVGSPLHSLRKRDTPVPAAVSAQLIIKDIGEIYSRLLDHRPIIQGEVRYFIKEFEEKRGLRELRVLEKLKSMVSETNNQTLPSCQEAMHNSLNQALQTCNQLKTDEIKNKAQRELLMKELECCQAEVDNKQRKAMEHLKEQYTEMEKDLSKCVSF